MTIITKELTREIKQQLAAAQKMSEYIENLPRWERSNTEALLDRLLEFVPAGHSLRQDFEDDCQALLDHIETIESTLDADRPEPAAGDGYEAIEPAITKDKLEWAELGVHSANLDWNEVA